MAASTDGYSGNTWSSAVIRKILSSDSLPQTTPKLAPDGARLAQRADQHAEPGGVQEVDPAEVDHHRADPAVEQLDDAFPQPGRGVDVHLATDLEHGVRGDDSGRQRQLHRPTS